MNAVATTHKSKNSYVVYRHSSKCGKVYIGITNQKPAEKRWKSGKGYYHNSYFQNAITKYGWETFTHEILYENLSAEDACEKEVELIASHRSNEKEFGYNLSVGGGGRIGVNHTEETKIKMSLSAKGKQKSESHKASISAANKKRFECPIERAKLSRCMKGKKLTPEHLKRLSESKLGRVFSYESKLKMSESAKTSWTNERKQKARKPVNKYSLDGEFIATYSGVRGAQSACGIKGGHISLCCNGKRKTTGGFLWRYKDE